MGSTWVKLAPTSMFELILFLQDFSSNEEEVKEEGGRRRKVPRPGTVMVHRDRTRRTNSTYTYYAAVPYDVTTCIVPVL